MVRASLFIVVAGKSAPSLSPSGILGLLTQSDNKK
jgi:hypothetical protein